MKKLTLVLILSLFYIHSFSQLTFSTTSTLPYDFEAASGLVASSGCSTVGLGASYKRLAFSVSNLPNPLSSANGLVALNLTLDNACGTNFRDLGFYLVAPDGRCMTVYVGTNSTFNYNDNSRYVSLSLRDASCLIFPNINSGTVYNNLSFSTGGNYGTFLAGSSASANRFSNVFNNSTNSNPLNPNGTWYLYIFHTSSVYGFPCITKAELVFGNTLVADRTPDGDNCSSAIVWNGTPFCATTFNKTGSNQMPGSCAPNTNFTTPTKIGGSTCDWNFANNNDIWIKIQPTQSGYFCINFSGIFGRYACAEPSGTCNIAQQSIVVTDADADKDGNPCTQLNNQKTCLSSGDGGTTDPYWKVVSCPNNNEIYSTTGGTSANQQHCFNVEANKVYYLVIDGFDGSNASFYVSGLFGPIPAQLDNNLLNLKGKILASGNQIDWQYAMDPAQVQRYELQRSRNGQQFYFLNNWLVDATTAKPAADYSYLDKSPQSGINYYRLKVVHKNGSEFYSSVVRLKTNNISKVSVFPNPTTDVLNVQSNNNIAQINIYNWQGQTIYTQKMVGGLQMLSIPTSGLPKGHYIVMVTDMNGNIEKTNFTKN